MKKTVILISHKFRRQMMMTSVVRISLCIWVLVLVYEGHAGEYK